MSRLYKIKLKQFEDCKKRLEALEEEYEAGSEQLDYTENRAGRKRLEREQAARVKEMEQVAQQYDLLEKELQELKAKDKGLQALESLLTPVDFETVLKAYRSCLSEGRPRAIPETLEALVKQLAEMPGEADELKPLLRFVSLLIQDQTLDSNRRKELQTWAEAQGLPPETSTSVKQPETVEICLMVKVQPRSLNDPSLGYLLSAAIVRDPDPLKPESNPTAKAIAIPTAAQPKSPPGYSQDELPQVLSELVAICGGEHSIPLTDLTVQWFLPSELMSLPVEHWQIRIGRNQQQCNGQRCKAVIVRSYDRHFSPDYQSAKGDWKKYWTRLLDCLESCCTETLVPLDPRAGKTTIDWSKPKAVGCKFIEHDSPHQQEDVWDNLLSQGVSIVLWMRQPGTKQQMTKVVNQCLVKSPTPIAELPAVLAQQRQKALSKASEADRLKAAPLCLLWDNPFRPFPTIDYQSA